MVDFIRCVVADSKYISEYKNCLKNQDYKWWVKKLEIISVPKQIIYPSILKKYNGNILRKDGNSQRAAR